MQSEQPKFIVQFASYADRDKVQAAIAADANSGLTNGRIYKREPWMVIGAASADDITVFAQKLDVQTKRIDLDVRMEPRSVQSQHGISI